LSLFQAVAEGAEVERATLVEFVDILGNGLGLLERRSEWF
jgi:hypothetical protein